MLDLSPARPTWKSPPSKAARLSAEVLPRAALTRWDLHRMYRLLEAYFQGTTFRKFEQDLEEKEYVILLRAADDDQVAGFSTLMKIPVTVREQAVVGFFSGDTIIAREHWGSSLLGRLWLKTVFSEADHIQTGASNTLIYWFLICSGYKTWRYLPVFFRRYWPNPEFSASSFDQEVLDTLARTKFGDEYDAAAGVVRFRHASPLRQGVAEVTEQRLGDPIVEFFVRKNPRHVAGDELACLAPISCSNLTAAGLRLLRAAEGR